MDCESRTGIPQCMGQAARGQCTCREDVDRESITVTNFLGRNWIGCEHGNQGSYSPPLLCESCYHAIRKAAKEEEEF